MQHYEGVTDDGEFISRVKFSMKDCSKSELIVARSKAMELRGKELDDEEPNERDIGYLDLTVDMLDAEIEYRSLVA